MKRTIILLTVSLLLLAACNAYGGASANTVAPPATTAPSAMTDMDENAGTDASGELSPAETQRAMIATAGLSGRDGDPRQVLTAATTSAISLGGWVESADLVDPDPGTAGDSYLNASFRVPSDSLNRFLAEATTLVDQVRDTSFRSQDVTNQVIDVEARLTNLRALEEELRLMLADARDSNADPTRVLTIFTELARIREQIEILEASQQNLAEQVAYASVALQVTETPAAPALVDEDGWHPLNTAQAALAALIAFATQLADGLIYAGVLLLPFGVLAYLGWRWLRRRLAHARRRVESVPS